MHRAARWIGLALVPALVACGGGDAPIEPVPPDSDALSLTAQVSKSSFVRGDSTKVTVTLRNTSPRTVRVAFTTTCTIVYAIREAGGGIVVPSGGAWFCPQAQSRIDLGPSEATQRVFTWRGQGLPAGNYIVYGVLGETMEVMSSGVAVELIEEPPDD